jgi:hypothetical protein
MSYDTNADPDTGLQTAVVILDGRVPSRELLQRDAILGKDVGIRHTLLHKVKGIAVIYYAWLRWGWGPGCPC